MKVLPILFNEILRSNEYAPYLLHKGKDVFINYAALPKDHYLPINGDYVMGLIFSGRLNENKSSLVELEVSADNSSSPSQ